MDSFLAHAAEILETAQSCVHAGGVPTELAILIGRSGEISIVAHSGWPLESLRRERGAEMAYRVASAGGRVSVEARATGRSCKLESETPAAVWRRLLDAAPLAPPLAALPAAATGLHKSV